MPSTELARKQFRILLRGMLLGSCVSACLAEYLLGSALRRLDAGTRSEILQKWSIRILAVMGIQVTVAGPVPAEGLVVSNHLSYVDILAFSAVVPCTFVSKNEVKSWPAIGWIASLAGAVFIDRDRRSQTHQVQPKIQMALESGSILVLFPEGTSSDGREVLPLHSSLFETAVATQSLITAAHISYELDEGDPGKHVSYWGDMTLVSHLVKLLSKTGVRATLRFADKPRVFTDRKQAVASARQEILELAGMRKTVQV